MPHSNTTSPLAQAFGNRTQQMVWGSAIIDSGPTHSFVGQSFLNTLGRKLKPTREILNIQFAEGQTVQCKVLPKDDMFVRE
jgi:hypothetical protein